MRTIISGSGKHKKPQRTTDIFAAVTTLRTSLLLSHRVSTLVFVLPIPSLFYYSLTSMARSAEIVTEMFEDMLMDTATHCVIVEADLVSENSYQETIQVLQKPTRILPYADEGLLPTLNDFYDSISTDTCPPEELLADAVITDSSSTENTSSDLFLSLKEFEEEEDDESNDEKTRAFQETLQKLAESMKRSQAIRQSLHEQTPKLLDYKRLGSVFPVIKSIPIAKHCVLQRYEITRFRCSLSNNSLRLYFTSNSPSHRRLPLLSIKSH